MEAPVEGIVLMSLDVAVATHIFMIEVAVIAMDCLPFHLIWCKFKELIHGSACGRDCVDGS